MVATARWFPQRPTIRQIDPTTKNITTGINAPNSAVRIAAAADPDDKIKNKTPTTIRIIRCDFTYLNCSSPDSKWLRIGENILLNTDFIKGIHLIKFNSLINRITFLINSTNMIILGP
ncbi:MAG: hypothetical protein ACI9WC_000260 [Arenicella sp.]|jgi:hypothetical protein